MKIDVKHNLKCFDCRAKYGCIHAINYLQKCSQCNKRFNFLDNCFFAIL